MSTINNVTFVTAKGAVIELSLVTSRASVADHTTMLPCYELGLKVNGASFYAAIRLSDDAALGKCISAGKVYIPVPAEKIEEVTAMIDGYQDEVARRIRQSIDDDNEYQSHRTAVYKLMNA